jgi:hypothetical protein
MIDAILKAVQVAFNVIGFFNRKPNPDEQRLKEDIELADAIKNGDSETVSKIRERRKHYSKIVILFIAIFMIGCSTATKDIPLTSGTIPYKIPAGKYLDVKGVQHNEDVARWSISEEDLYNNTRQIKPEKQINWEGIIFLGLITFSSYVIGNIILKYLNKK